MGNHFLSRARPAQTLPQNAHRKETEKNAATGGGLPAYVKGLRCPNWGAKENKENGEKWEGNRFKDSARKVPGLGMLAQKGGEGKEAS